MPDVERAAVGLGGNVGDPEATLRTAVRGLAAVPGVDLVAVSSPYRTAPVGLTDQPDFLNAVALVETTLEPPTLLGRLRMLEAAAGRVRRVRWGPRTLDLDLLLHGGRTLSSAELTLPHPRLVERRFVLEPLLEVWPDARLPDGSSLAERLERLPPGGVERLAQSLSTTL
jgi:2-amino-4-hydroxy-6-hydroxymethyldihydropteridine diphosphokinase